MQNRDLGYGRWRLLQRRAGEALERMYPDEVVVLDRHFDCTGQTETAVRYLLRAGDQARGLYACQEAVRPYQRALALQREQGDDRYLGFDVRGSPFEDPRARRAFAHATDREPLASVAMSAYANPAENGIMSRWPLGRKMSPLCWATQPSRSWASR